MRNRRTRITKGDGGPVPHEGPGSSWRLTPSLSVKIGIVAANSDDAIESDSNHALKVVVDSIPHTADRMR